MASNVTALPSGRVGLRRRTSVAGGRTPTQLGLSPRTFAVLRWTQVIGQLTAVLVAALVFDLDIPLATLLALVGVGALTTLWAMRQLTPPHRLDESQLGSLLLLDASQIGAMLGLTGALSNPFALFLLFPAILAATTLSVVWWASVCGVVVLVTSLLAFADSPVLWADSAFRLPPLLTLGTWAALSAGTVMIACYAWRIAEEGRRMGRALAATQLALEREQRLSHLDGIATAVAHDLGSPLSTIGLLAKEIVRGTARDQTLAADARLLEQQVGRCRDILARFADDAPARAKVDGAVVPLSFILERLCADHQDGAMVVRLTTAVSSDALEPTFPPTGEVRHALANLLDNAVIHARSHVGVALVVDRERTTVRMTDDGPGFPPEVLNHVGEPFVSTRGDGATHGLGLFIACTFLTRASAELELENTQTGAIVSATWPAVGAEGKS